MLEDEVKESMEQFAEEKEKLRQNAVLNELARLKTAIGKKKKIIISLGILLGIVICTLIALQWHVFNTKSQLAELQKQQAVPKTVGLTEKTVKKSTLLVEEREEQILVHFKALPDFPLAAFTDVSKAQQFYKELQKMSLPKMSITKDTTGRQFNQTAFLNGDTKYFLQLGAYKQFYLKNYLNELINLDHQNKNGLHKYRLGPFSSRAQGKKIAKQIGLREVYVVRK